MIRGTGKQRQATAMPDPKCLRVGDLVRFVKLPDEWAQPGHSVSRSSVLFMKRLIRRSWPSRVHKIDEYGQPWIQARMHEKGRYHYHSWAIVEASGWRLVRRLRRRGRRP